MKHVSGHLLLGENVSCRGLKYVNIDEFIKTYLGAGYDIFFSLIKIYLGYHGNQRPKKLFMS